MEVAIIMACPYNCRNGRIFNTVLKTYQPCPHCAGAIQEVNNDNLADERLELLEMLDIPNRYRNAKFDPDNFFREDAKLIFASQTFKPVIEQLTSIEIAIMNSNILQESCYIYTGPNDNADVLSFVYSCLRQAVLNGLSTVPYVSLLDLQGIRSKTKALSRVYSRISYYDFALADICFVSATSEATASEASVLADLLSERERHDLPTYVFGYWSTHGYSSNKHSMRYLIGSSSRLGVLHPYEIMTKKRMEEERQQRSQSELTRDLLSGIDKNIQVLGVTKSIIPPQHKGGVDLIKYQVEDNNDEGI